jgi:putative N6-adenine-specific DNA methylase
MIPFIKRIKRRIIGRTHAFLASTQPGFEFLCFKEFQSFPNTIQNPRLLKGGVEFQGRLNDCYISNLYLKTGHRILMRIETIRATRFSEFEKKISQIPWNLFLYPGSQIHIHATTRHCRLFHTEGISERLQSGITKSFNLGDSANNFSPVKTYSLYVRGFDDQFTLSVDSSGENLYKRGLKVHVGIAPLRETTAAAALLLAGYRGDLPLIDPFCGSGTFSLEAALIAKNIPPGWFRSFAFFEWPSFRKQSWNFLRRQAEHTFRRIEKRPMIFASDIDVTACSHLRDCASRFGLSDIISVFNLNFFDLNPTMITSQKGFVAINPPYGWRLETSFRKRSLMTAVVDRLQSLYRGWKFILFTPEQKPDRRFLFFNHYQISHGGRKVNLFIGEIP